jgi:hypothetical protein
MLFGKDNLCQLFDVVIDLAGYVNAIVDSGRLGGVQQAHDII